MVAVTESGLVAMPDDKEAEGRRKLAILKAVGLDKAAPEQRELAIAIAKRYDLDLMLKHLVLIDGKPYVTRDALLWIAHRSGAFDGIEVTEPVQDNDYWRCSASVWRKDMSHAFTYSGRYPVKGGNARFGPEMAVKVAESMALRRAFNISAPTQDERWDVEVPTAEPAKSASLAERAAVPVFLPSPDVTDHVDEQTATPEATPATADLPIPESTPAEFKALVGPEVPDDGQPEPKAKSPKAAMVQCEALSPWGVDEAGNAPQCRREQGHPGPHRTTNESW